MNPILPLPLFPKLDQKLITLLQSLSAEDWQRQTISPLWKVHDVALHLLAGNIRALSMLRDGSSGVKPGNIGSYQDLVGYLNQLNADWIVAMRRVSPNVLIDLLETTGRQYIAFLETLDPFGTASFSVAWAGEDKSANWFHIAREYTEKWHHQQQIRLAVGQAEALYTKEYYFPYLDTSMRALPHHYRAIKGKKDDTLKFTVMGEGGGDWYLQSDGHRWSLKAAPEHEPICAVRIADTLAWRIFTKGIAKTEAEKQVVITGRADLGAHILDMLAVMA